ncbi:MAG TPA: TAXI family TRAP transporter solute-binding subunit, partial [Humisphaera sp.]
MPADQPPTSPPPSDPPPAAGDALPLYERYRKRGGRWDALRGYWPWVFLAACLLAGGWFLVKPAPPTQVVLAAGPKDGAYAWFAERYKQTFAENGVSLDIRETLGSVDNYRQLDEAAKADKGPSLAVGDGVSVAIVQSGTCPPGITAEIQAVASLYLEPVWIFYRGDRGLQLEDLRGRRVAVGPEGSGTRSIAIRLLGATGIEYTDQPQAAVFAQLLRAAGIGLDPFPTTAPTSGPTTGPSTAPATGPARARV